MDRDFRKEYDMTKYSPEQRKWANGMVKQYDKLRKEREQLFTLKDIKIALMHAQDNSPVRHNGDGIVVWSELHKELLKQRGG